MAWEGPWIQPPDQEITDIPWRYGRRVWTTENSASYLVPGVVGFDGVANLSPLIPDSLLTGQAEDFRDGWEGWGGAGDNSGDNSSVAVNQQNDMVGYARATVVSHWISPTPAPPPEVPIEIPPGMGVEYEGGQYTTFSAEVRWSTVAAVTQYDGFGVGESITDFDHLPYVERMFDLPGGPPSTSMPGARETWPTPARVQEWDEIGVLNTHVDTAGAAAGDERAQQTVVRSFTDRLNLAVISDWYLGAQVPDLSPPEGTRRSVLNVSSLLGIRITGIYRPPRYRFVRRAAGMWNLRQRQSLTGNAGGWPLRQRQTGGATGSWPLRQRQTGT